MASIQHAVMINLTEQVKLKNRYNLCVRHLQVLFKRYGNHTHKSKTSKYYRPEFYANATLFANVLCCKHYISMYLDEHLTKLWISAK